MSHQKESIEITRRPLVQAAGLAGVLASLGAGAAHASASRAPTLDFEKANEDLVNNFCWDWSKLDVEALIPYLADNIEYLMFEGRPLNE